MGSFAGLLMIHVAFGNVILGFLDAISCFIFYKHKNKTKYIELAIFFILANALIWWLVWRICLSISKADIITPFNYGKYVVLIALTIFILTYFIKFLSFNIFNFLAKFSKFPEKLSIKQIVKSASLMAVTSNAIVISAYLLASIDPTKCGIRLDPGKHVPGLRIYFLKKNDLFILESGRTKPIENTVVCFLQNEQGFFYQKEGGGTEKLATYKDIIRWHERVFDGTTVVQRGYPSEIFIDFYTDLNQNVVKKQQKIRFETAVSGWNIKRMLVCPNKDVLFVANTRLYCYSHGRNSLSLLAEGDDFLCVRAQ